VLLSSVDRRTMVTPLVVAERGGPGLSSLPLPPPSASRLPPAPPDTQPRASRFALPQAVLRRPFLTAAYF